MDFNNNFSDHVKKRGYYSEIVIGNENRSVESYFTSTVPRQTQLAWQIAVENNTPIIPSLKIEPAHQCLREGKRWITFPENPNMLFPAKTFFPKVQMDKNVPPKCISRNVEIERRRRIYRQLKTEDILQEKGIFPRHILPVQVIQSFSVKNEQLALDPLEDNFPLEVFDDEEYDCRSPEDWMSLGNVDGVQYPLPANVFVASSSIEMCENPKNNVLDNIYSWQNAAVSNYNSLTKLWTITVLKDQKRMYLVPRIYIRFYAEDPRIFCNRIEASLKERCYAVSLVRYNLYLDRILPKISDISYEEREMISNIVSRNIEFHSKDITKLVENILLDYKRVICDIHLRQNKSITDDTVKLIPDIKFYEMKKNIIHTGMTDFINTKHLFHWNTLYVHNEIYEAMLNVNTECIKVSNMNLFTTNFAKPVTIEEFETLQLKNVETVIAYLQNEWTHKIVQSLRVRLRTIGKGWFDIEQKNHDVYDFMKLKRLMNLTKMLMQTSLRNLINNSLKVFHMILGSQVLCTQDVRDDFHSNSDFSDSQFNDQCKPIFKIEINMNFNGAYCSPEPKTFVTRIISILDNALNLCHEIKQIHPLILTNLKFPKNSFLNSVGLLEPEVKKVKEQLAECYGKSIMSLLAYCQQCNKYLEFVRLDINDYIETIKSKHILQNEIKDEIMYHIEMKYKVEEAFPKAIFIGLFYINIQSLRNCIINKHERIVTKLLNFFAQQLRYQIDNMYLDYEDIDKHLKDVNNDEKGTPDFQSWITSISLNMTDLDTAMAKIMVEYDTLDTLKFNISDDDFSMKLKILGFAYNIRTQIKNSNFLIKN